MNKIIKTQNQKLYNKDFNKSDLTTFLHKRINEYETKQKEAQD